MKKFVRFYFYLSLSLTSKPHHFANLFPFLFPFSQGGERSVLSGDGQSESNLTEQPSKAARINERNYQVESEYEYGSRAGFWRLFRLFNKYNMHFTLYAVAQAVEELPEVAKRCVEMGHDVASHAYRWVEYHDMSVEEEMEWIRKALVSLKGLTGQAPKGWYYGRASPRSRTLVPQVYEEMGEKLVWMSDSYADDVSGSQMDLSVVMADF